MTNILFGEISSAGLPPMIAVPSAFSVMVDEELMSIDRPVVEFMSSVSVALPVPSPLLHLNRIIDSSDNAGGVQDEGDLPQHLPDALGGDRR